MCNKARPPEVMLKDGLGAEDSHVPQEWGRVNRMEKGRVGRGRNKHPFAKVKMAIIERPVRESGTSEQRGSLIQSCKSFENKGVRGGG